MSNFSINGLPHRLPTIKMEAPVARTPEVVEEENSLPSQPALSPEEPETSNGRTRLKPGELGELLKAQFIGEGLLRARQTGPSYGTIELMNGTTSVTKTEADWKEAGLPDAIFDKCFTRDNQCYQTKDRELQEAKYGLCYPYTGLKEVGGGGDANGTFRTFSVSMNDGKNGEVHFQTIKVYDDGTTSVRDNYKTSYPNSESGKAFNSDKLEELGIDENMVSKYFAQNDDGTYSLQEPYTSFEITRFEGDTEHSRQISFVNNGDHYALSDMYFYDNDGNRKASLFTGNQGQQEDKATEFRQKRDTFGA